MELIDFLTFGVGLFFLGEEWDKRGEVVCWFDQLQSFFKFASVVSKFLKTFMAFLYSVEVSRRNKFH